MKRIKKLQSKPWKHEIIHWNLLTSTAASLMVEQSTQMLNATIETANSISSRADKLLSVLLPIFSALIIYISTSKFSYSLTFLQLAAITTGCMLLIALLYCMRNLKKYTIATAGNLPSDIVLSEFVDPFITEENNSYQYASMILAICESIESKIVKNQITNKSRMRNNTIAFWIISLIPLVSPLLSYVLMNLNLHYCALVHV